MNIKVCGMKHPENMAALCQLPIHMIGLIFYNKSSRYAGNLQADTLKMIPSSIQKVGVFVDETMEKILGTVEKYDLDIIQLHGDESPMFCKYLQDKGIKIIKAFPLAEAEDLQQCIDYENCCDYFLFDSKTSQYGGSGKKFDWQILSHYHGQTPFFLSGGIGAEDIRTIRRLTFPQLYAIDLNSRFEIEPGIKDIAQIQFGLQELVINKFKT